MCRPRVRSRLSSAGRRAGAPAGKTLRGKALASYVLAKARDGYQVVFALAEFDPAFANEQILVVDKRDGRPLTGNLGSFRLVCPNDKAGARSARMLETIELVSLRKWCVKALRRALGRPATASFAKAS